MYIHILKAVIPSCLWKSQNKQPIMYNIKNQSNTLYLKQIQRFQCE